jgi:hypothetical protein
LRTFEGLGVCAEINMPKKHIYHGLQAKDHGNILCYNCFKLNKGIKESVLEK